MSSAERQPRTLADPLVAGLREQISAVDRELLELVNRRLELVRRLHGHKRAVGLPLRDPEREQALLDALVAENRGPLTDEGLRTLFRELIELSFTELTP